MLGAILKVFQLQVPPRMCTYVLWLWANFVLCHISGTKVAKPTLCTALTSFDRQWKKYIPNFEMQNSCLPVQAMIVVAKSSLLKSRVASSMSMLVLGSWIPVTHMVGLHSSRKDKKSQWKCEWPPSPLFAIQMSPCLRGNQWKLEQHWNSGWDRKWEPLWTRGKTELVKEWVTDSA